MPDEINHPSHYTDGPVHSVCGEVMEVIDWTETFNFNRGNVFKYLARAGKKGGPELELVDLGKARWYLEREIKRLETHRKDDFGEDLTTRNAIAVRPEVAKDFMALTNPAVNKAIMVKEERL